MAQILNISTYKFVTLNQLEALRDKLHAQALQLNLKGTILLAEEGINLFLAGTADAIHTWLKALKNDPRFANMEAKESWSETVPFKKLLVKIKPEIIRMNHATIRPDQVGPAGRAPAVAPDTLRHWLEQGHDDAGRPVVTLDTRNAFEVDHGSFSDAIDWRIDKFSEFPDQVQAHKADFDGKTVVSFCTGGIRCEKAALYMQAAGIDHVYQLEGGILKYLELTDGKHWQGQCFVFDEREALGLSLSPAISLAPSSSS